jgi:glycosyltransferase involved in cell wall biosynthesis
MVERSKSSNDLTVPSPFVLNVITTSSGGGAQVLVRKLSSLLVDNGIEATGVYFKNNLQGERLEKNEIVLGVGERSLFSILKIRKIVKDAALQYDKIIVHSHLTWPLIYVPIACYGLDVELIYTEHSTYNKRRKMSILRYPERLLYSKYSKIICISNGVRHALLDWLGSEFEKKISVIENGANLYTYKERSNFDDSRKLKFISIGSLNEKKGFDTSIRALALLGCDNWEYNILGEGSRKKDLEILINELGLDDKVHLLGWQNDVETYLLNSDIQLIPSVWEGFGLVAVEGMSTGLPVVASDVPGLRDVLNPNNPAICLVKEFSDPIAFNQKIIECIERLNVNATKMSIASRKQAEKYSIEKMVERYAELYRETVRSDHR